MATPTIEPPKSTPPSRKGVSGPPDFLRKPRFEIAEPDELHLLIDELRDDATRSRMREAVWISIILHLVFLFTVRQLPRMLPHKDVALLTPEQMLQDKNRELTFIEQPKDTQKITVKPETNKVSDKDRVASSRNPRIDRQTLERLQNNRRDGAPGQDPRQAFAQPPPQLSPQQMASNTPPPIAQTNPNAKLEEPQSQPNKNIFRSTQGAPTSAVDEAVRETARSRGGVGGEYGGGPGTLGSPMRSDVEILSDTMGVDFFPYIQRLRTAIMLHWEPLIPEVARSPLAKQGNVRIRFVIGKTGKVEGMVLEGPSGDVSMDRAAWGAIVGSNPFPPLPKEFRGDIFALRVMFQYNPSASAIR